ncbi:MAG: phosphatidylserine decarboxylase [Pseudomonadota bacterium]
MTFSTLLQPVLLALALMLPVAAKWQLYWGKATVGAVLAGCGAAVATRWIPAGWPCCTILAQAVFIVLLSAAMLLYVFHRDPERMPPDGGEVVVSPADGRILYIKELPGGRIATSYKQGWPFELTELRGFSGLLAEGGWLVGIAMNFLDVHVNRAPIRGEVVLSRLIKGKALSLKRLEALGTNTRRTTLIEGAWTTAAVIQITSRLVRQISCYIRRGDLVEAGQRIGMIRFGSQVDVLLPKLPGMVITCRPGQRVKAGESVIASRGTTEGRGTSAHGQGTADPAR